ILEENENELYLSFEGNGFGIFNKQTGKLKIIDEKNGLPSKYTYEMIKDSEGNHWMTSYGEGIIRFRDTSFKIYDDAHGLPSKIVNGFVDWKGEWLVATEAGLVAFNSEKQIRPITKALSIKNILITPQNNLQYSAEGKVLELSSVDAAPKLIDEGVYTLMYNDQKKTFLFETNKVKVLEADSTYYINTRRPIGISPIGDRYILCKIAGLYQLKDGIVDTIPGLDPLIHYNFRSIASISENELIAGSEKKLYRITLANNDFKIQTYDL